MYETRLLTICPTFVYVSENGYENALNRHLRCMKELLDKMPGDQDWNRTCRIATMTSSAGNATMTSWAGNEECFAVAARLTPLQVCYIS